MPQGLQTGGLLDSRCDFKCKCYILKKERKFFVMSEIRLKPCPFCGGEAKVEYVGNKVYIRCKPCGARTVLCDTVRWAAKCWNYRKGHKTFREYFDENFPLDKFPQFSESARNTGAICVKVLFGDDAVAVPCCEMTCAECWDMEMQNADLTHGER